MHSAAGEASSPNHAGPPVASSLFCIEAYLVHLQFLNETFNSASDLATAITLTLFRNLNNYYKTKIKKQSAHDAYNMNLAGLHASIFIIKFQE